MASAQDKDPGGSVIGVRISENIEGLRTAIGCCPQKTSTLGRQNFFFGLLLTYRADCFHVRFILTYIMTSKK